MQGLNAVPARFDMQLLRRSQLFQKGKALPPATHLISLLNQLDRARNAGDPNEAHELVQAICDIAPVSGTYNGYLGDDLNKSDVRVDRVWREGHGANIHSFRILLQILEGFEVVDIREMDLIEFLVEIRREGKPGEAYLGPRFEPI